MKSVRITQEMTDAYMAQGYWTQETLSGIWQRNARMFPDKLAFVDRRGELTWRQLEDTIDNLALHLLDMGLRRDDVLVCQLPNWTESIQLRMACEKAGVLFAGAILPFRHTEMEHILKVTQAAVVVIPRDYRGFNYLGMMQELKQGAPGLKHIVLAGGDAFPGTISLDSMLHAPPPGRDRRQLDGVAYPSTETSAIGITSGTTGLPKCVEWSSAVILYMLKVFVRESALTADDVSLSITPVVTGIGFPTTFSTALAGGKSVLQERFEAEDALQLIERERVTFFMAVPAQLVMMLRHPNFSAYNLSSLRAIRVSGAPLPPDVAVEVEKRFGCPLLNMYGAADGGGFSLVAPGEPPEVRYHTTGKVFPGLDIKLVDEAGQEAPGGEVGEVWARGPSCYPGYFGDPEAVLKSWGSMGKDGWFRTGDLGYFDANGNLALAGRRKDMIIRGGQNVYPAEIENLLLTHPNVLTVAVVGMPDPVMGEKACAYVVPKDGLAFTFDEMVSFLKGKNIASFKLPERLEVVDKLPTSGGGLKIMKRELAQDIANKLKAEGKL